MKRTELDDFIDAGTNALGAGEPLKALVLFERAAAIDATPTVISSLAYCLARERGQIKTGHRTCQGLTETDPDNLFHYLNLGRIMLLEGNRRAAIKAFRSAIELEPHPQVIAELAELGVRKQQAIGFLDRDNPLNKYLGLLCDRLTWRKLDKSKDHAENS